MDKKKVSMCVAEAMVFCAALAVIVGCRHASDERCVQIFPEPFKGVYFGLPEADFTNVWPKAVFDTNSVDGAWWNVGKTGQFEDVSFYFKSPGVKPNKTLTDAMLDYRAGTSLREVLADAESRLGPAPSCKTTLYCHTLIFERTWRFARGEATLIHWPWATGMHLQWRFAETGSSSVHDGFAEALPSNIVNGVVVGFHVRSSALAEFNPYGHLSVEATSRLFDALSGWEAFDPFDLETSLLQGDEANNATHSAFWLVDLDDLERWHFAIGKDASWVANLGTNGVARTIPESRRQAILSALATLTNAPFSGE